MANQPVGHRPGDDGANSVFRSDIVNYRLPAGSMSIHRFPICQVSSGFPSWTTPGSLTCRNGAGDRCQ